MNECALSDQEESVVRALISYEPLWKTMKDKGVTTYTLIYKEGFSAYTITSLRRGKSITMNTLKKLCRVLDCTPNEVVAFPEEEAGTSYDCLTCEQSSGL